MVKAVRLIFIWFTLFWSYDKNKFVLNVFCFPYKLLFLITNDCRITPNLCDLLIMPIYHKPFNWDLSFCLSGMWNNRTIIHIFTFARSFGSTCDSIARENQFANRWSDCCVFAKHSRISDCSARLNWSWPHCNVNKSNLHSR